MSTDTEIQFVRNEILSFLPTGWVLPDDQGTGSWDPERQMWQITVRDLADQEWQITVDGETAARHGRIEALRQATRTLERRALGRRSIMG